MSPMSKEQINYLEKAMDEFKTQNRLEHDEVKNYVKESVSDLKDEINKAVKVFTDGLACKADKSAVDELTKEVRTKPLIVGIFTGIVSAIFGFLIANFFSK